MVEFAFFPLVHESFNLLTYLMLKDSSFPRAPGAGEDDSSEGVACRHHFSEVPVVAVLPVVSMPSTRS